MAIYNDETLTDMSVDDLYFLQRMVLREIKDLDGDIAATAEYRQQLVNEQFELEEAINANNRRDFNERSR
jgi:hypothetical protein